MDKITSDESLYKRLLPAASGEKFVLVIAGPNGSGKTTFAKEMLKGTNLTYLNPDEFLAEMGEGARSFTAARKLITARINLVKEGGSFVLETTLSGRTFETVLKDIKANHYRVFIFFTWLDNPRLCVERIKIRVAAGGHHVPDEEVRQRFYRSHNNFWSKYRFIANQWVVFYNGHTHPKLVAAGSGRKREIISKDLYSLYREVLSGCRSKAIRKRDKEDI